MKKLIKTFLLIGIALSTFFITFSTMQPLEVYAEGNGEGVDDGSDLKRKDGQGYPSYAKTGWLVYLADTSGNLCSPVVFVSSTGNSFGSGFKTTFLKSRIGNASPSSQFTGAEWGAPFTSDGSGRGSIIKTELSTGHNYSSDGSLNSRYVIGTYLGQEINDLINEDQEKYYLVLEDCAWHKVFSGSAKGRNVVASSSGWAKFQQATGIMDGGDGHTGWCDNFRLQRSCYLNLEWPGLPHVPTYLGSSASSCSSRISQGLINQNYGYGMIAIRLKDDAIHTYWASNGSPGDTEPAPPSKIGTMNMVKTYYTEVYKNNVLISKTADGTFSEPNCISTISIDDEPEEYSLEKWSINGTYNPSITYANFPSGTRMGTTPQVVNLKTPEKTVYVLLKRVITEDTEEKDYNYLLKQSQITRKVTFSEPDNWLSMKDITEHDFSFYSQAFLECLGHTWEYTETESYDTNGDGTNDGTREKVISGTSYCSGWDWVERELMLSIYNSRCKSFPTVLATGDKFKPKETDFTMGEFANKHFVKNDTPFLRASEAGGIESKTVGEVWDYICVLMRGADKLTVAEYENSRLGTNANEDLADASSEGFTVSDHDSGTRKIQDYYEDFSAYFTDDPDNDDNTKREPTVDATKPGEAHWTSSPSPRCEAETRFTKLLNILTLSKITVKIEVYSGKNNGGTADESINSDTTSYDVPSPLWNGGKKSGRMVKSGGTISFRPYVMMRYHTIASAKDSKGEKAYVLSEFQRSIVPNDYAEIVWNQTADSNPNLTLISTQWSTHAQSTADWGSNNVLPGGATLSLTIKKNDRQKVTVNTYQCIIADGGSGEMQIDKMGGDKGGLTNDLAISSHEAFVQSVVGALEATNIQQYVETNPSAHDAFGGLKVNPGVNITSLHNMTTGDPKASMDDKYYFRNDSSSEPAQEGDLDVKEVGTNTYFYTYFTDTYGRTKYVEGITVGNNDVDGAPASDPFSNLINQRTLVVDKLMKAVEQQAVRPNGECFDDEALTGELWYNEAFDGITVMIQSTELTVGYIDPPERAQVLDPKLIPINEEKSDMFSEYFLSQIKTRKYSQEYGEDKEYVIGEFKGQLIQMLDLDRLFHSRKFWIPNATVQDLY